MKKKYTGSIAVAMSGLLPLVAQVAQAEVNPFALSELSSAYMQTAEAKPADDAAKMKDGACGEGKCGAAMMKPVQPAIKKLWKVNVPVINLPHRLLLQKIKRTKPFRLDDRTNAESMLGIFVFRPRNFRRSRRRL